MKLFFAIVLAFLINACATLPTSTVIAAEQPPLTVEATMPIVCMNSSIFDQVTGPRSGILSFDDVIGNVRTEVHVATFIDIDDNSVVIIYHEYPDLPDLTCIVHATPSTTLHLTLEGLI